MDLAPDCKKCKLHVGVHSYCIPGEGPKHPDIVVIGEAPGVHEDRQGRPFVGESGTKLREVIEQLGLTDRCYITNAVRCRPPKNRTPRLVELRSCRHFLQEELDKIRPAWIVLLGGTAIRTLTGERNPKVGQSRGLQSWVYPGRRFQAQVVATYHPAAALREPKHWYDIIDDFCRILAEPPTPVEQVNWTYLEKVSPKDIPKTLAFDLETSTLSPWGDGDRKILSVAWSGSKDRAFVTRDIVGFAHGLAERAKLVIGHNVKFDLLWLKEKTGLDLNFALFDTLVAAHLCNENLPAKNLKYLAQLHTGYGNYSREIMPVRNKQAMGSLDPEVLFRYNAYDAAATFRLYKVYDPILKTEKLTPLMDAQMEVLRSLVLIEGRGILVLRERVSEAVIQHETEIQSRVRSLHRLDSRLRGVNLDSPKQLAQFLFTKAGLNLPVTAKTAGNAPSTDEPTLKVLLGKFGQGHNRKILESILEQRSLKKILGTYLVNIENRTKVEPRIHPSYNITGTVTGRLSCSDPNLQNLPRAATSDAVKQCFIASPQMVLVEADYSQIELRVGAHLSGDPRMIQAFREGRDLHTETAMSLYHTPAPTPEERSHAKTINFGIFYGMGPYNLAERTGMTVDQARGFIEKWFATYPSVRKWLHAQESLLLDRGYVVSLFGRRRRLPSVVTDTSEERYKAALRQACNFPVQSAAAEMTLLAMACLSADGLRVLANIHDAILCEVPKRELRSSVAHIRSVMENPVALAKRYGFSIRLSVPTPVEIKAGQDWGQMEVLNAKAK